MMRNEAAWLERELAQLPDSSLDPVLSLGSGGAQFRDDKQPWIADLVYEPLVRRGITVVHHEYRDGPGVDVAGDLADPAFVDRLREVGARGVLCCNVLEHLADRTPLLDGFARLVGPGGVLVLTVPYCFPYHADPIDTMYRPSVDELDAALPDFELVAGAAVPCGTLWRYLLDSPDARTSIVTGLKTAVRQLTSRGDTNGDHAGPGGPAPRGGSALPYFIRPTSVTCAVFRRRA